MYSLHTYCRACGYAKPGASGIKASPSEKLIEVFDLGIQPLANDFCREGMQQAGYAPLKVLYCPRCSLGQLSVVVDPNILYRHYPYVTSQSEMMTEHFKQLIFDIGRETEGKNVLEIGSNDGRLLGMMKDGAGYSVRGVDPAENLAAVANGNGIPTQVGFFGRAMGVEIPPVDIVIARHVFCHVDDWQDFVGGLEMVCHDETLICIEVPYAADTLRNCEFDTVYHEHLSYLTIKSLQALLAGTSLHLHRVIRYPIHGGAILLMLRTNDSKCKGQAVPEDDITEQDWRKFKEQSDQHIAELIYTVGKLRSDGSRVAALGASAKSTVWISACEFTHRDIAFIADTTPQKLYTTSPGTDIPIVDEGAILRELPDYVVLFAWNYREEVLQKFALAREKGVKFIVPVPKIEVV